MSELISGKEALSKVHECVVQYKCDTDTVKDRWTTITDHFWDQYNLGVFLNKDTTWKFRLKPRTVTLNGVELSPCLSIGICRIKNEVSIQLKDESDAEKLHDLLAKLFGFRG